MNTIQLNPPIPMTCPKGNGYAIFMFDYGVEHNLFFTLAIDATGELWTFDTTQVRMQKNIMLGRIIDNSYLLKDKIEDKK